MGRMYFGEKPKELVCLTVDDLGGNDLQMWNPRHSSIATGPICSFPTRQPLQPEFYISVLRDAQSCKDRVSSQCLERKRELGVSWLVCTCFLTPLFSRAFVLP